MQRFLNKQCLARSDPPWPLGEIVVRREHAARQPRLPARIARHAL